MGNKPNNQDTLRAKADAHFEHLPQAKQMPHPAEEILHEFRVHQIDLEMQTETLRQMQVELEKSRDHYVDLYDFAPVGYIALNHDGIINAINLTGTALLGLERNKLPYHRFASYVAAEDRDRWHHHFLRVLRQDGVQRCELKLQRSDGSYFHAMLDCLRKEYDRESQVRISINDITERKNMEADINLQRRRAEALLELPGTAEQLDEVAFLQYGMELAESLTDSQISFIHFVNDNEETIELITWSRRTLEQYCHATFDKHYPVCEAGIWADALRKHQPVIFNDYASYPNKLGLPKGHSELVRLISVPVIENGKVVMLTGVGNKETDYTDADVETVQLLSNNIWYIAKYRRTQKQLAQFSRVLEQSLNEIYIFDSETLRFVDANLGAQSNLGYTVEELQQMTLLDINPEFTAESFAALVEPLRVKKMQQIKFLTLLLRKNGSSYFAEIHMEMTQDVPPLFVAVIMDITERKKMETEILERRKEMEYFQKRHVAAQTASAIAHELNQPLLAIASYSEAALMLIKAEKPNLDKIQKAIEGCERQAHRAGQSIREMLELLSMKEFPREVFDLNKEVVEILNSARLEHELKFSPVLNLEDGLPFVLANRFHVQKVLLNLFHNCIDAMQEAGVPLPAITVTVTTKKGESVAQVTIQDNGPGVKKEDFQRLFDPFFTTKTNGIGMGLAISRSLIEENGGQLWIDPQEDPGATFHLTLPFAT